MHFDHGKRRALLKLLSYQDHPLGKGQSHAVAFPDLLSGRWCVQCDFACHFVSWTGSVFSVLGCILVISFVCPVHMVSDNCFFNN